MIGDGLWNQLVAKDIPLDQIFLDPNNPRFAEFNHTPVNDDNIEAAQERVLERLMQPEYQVEKLRMTMEENGYLPIDRVIVRYFSDDKYVVLEGNRRIASAKSLMNLHKQGALTNPSIVESLRLIPCMVYTGSDLEAAWVFQGLRHITGIQEWSAFNKAKLLVDQMRQFDLNLTEVGKRFGLTPHGAGQWVRGYSAYTQACETTDYVGKVHEGAYPYFQELFSQSSIAVREWMEWDDKEMSFKDELKFNEFISWLYPKADDDSEVDFEKRRLSRRDDLRTLAYLIRQSNGDEFYLFRSGMELEEAYSIAMSRNLEEANKNRTDPMAKLFDTLDKAVKELDNIPHRVLRDSDAKMKLFEKLDSLVVLIDDLRQS
ncbi:MAG: hypothetical protein ACYDCO_12530 [Armatimonadota bacterium]